MADISNSTYWSETDANNNQPSPNGWGAGMAPNQVEPTARADRGAIKRFWDRINPTVLATGTANNYVVTYSVSPASYVVGEIYSWRVNVTNTGTSQVNIGALTNLNIVRNDGTNVQAGDLTAGYAVSGCYDGTNFRLTSPPLQVPPTATLTSGNAGQPIVVNTGGTAYTLGAVPLGVTGSGYAGGTLNLSYVNAAATNSLYVTNNSTTAGTIAQLGVETGTSNSYLTSYITEGSSGPTANLTVGSGVTNGLNIQAPTGLNIAGNVAITGNLSLTSLNNFSTFGFPGLIWFAAGLTPSGWLQCNGQAVSRTTYANLFAVISTAYGAGDGSTTFNLPNAVGKTLVGQGTGWTIASTGGASTATISQANLPNVSFTGTANLTASATGTSGNDSPTHTHQFAGGNQVGLLNTSIGGSNALGSGVYGASYVVSTGNASNNHTHSLSVTGTATGGISVASGGSGTAVSIQNPYLAVNVIIKY